MVSAKSPRDIQSARIRKLEEIDIPAARALVDYEGSSAVMRPKRERRLQDLLGRLEEMKRDLASLPDAPAPASSFPPLSVDARPGSGHRFPLPRPHAPADGVQPRPLVEPVASRFPIPRPRPAIPEGATSSAADAPLPGYRPRPEGPDPLVRVAGAVEKIAAAGIAPPVPMPVPKPIDILSLFATTGAGKISAEVAGPVTADLTGQANVNVNIRYIGPIGPAGTSVSSSGHIRANIGVSMPDVE